MAQVGRALNDPDPNRREKSAAILGVQLPEQRQQEEAAKAEQKRSLESVKQAQRDAAKAQKEQEAATKATEKETFNTEKNRREALYRREGRPSYVDASGMIQATHPDEVWTKMKADKEAAATAKTQETKADKLAEADRLQKEVDLGDEVSRATAEWQKVYGTPEADAAVKKLWEAQGKLKGLSGEAKKAKIAQLRRDNAQPPAPVPSAPSGVTQPTAAPQAIDEGQDDVGGVVPIPSQKGSRFPAKPIRAPKPGASDDEIRAYYGGTPPDLAQPQPSPAEDLAAKEQDFQARAQAHQVASQAAQQPLQTVVDQIRARGVEPLVTNPDGTQGFAPGVTDDEKKNLRAAHAFAKEASVKLEAAGTALQQEQTTLQEQRNQQRAAQQTAQDADTAKLAAKPGMAGAAAKIQQLDKDFRALEARETDPAAKQAAVDEYNRQRTTLQQEAEATRKKAWDDMEAFKEAGKQAGKGGKDVTAVLKHWQTELPKFAAEHGMSPDEAFGLWEDHTKTTEWDNDALTAEDGARVLSDGAVVVNPALWVDSEKFEKAVKDTDASEADKQRALSVLPELKKEAAANLLNQIAKSESLAEMVNSLPGKTDEERVDALLKLRRDSPMLKAIGARLNASAESMAGGIMGLISMATGNQWATESMQRWNERAGAHEALAGTSGLTGAAEFATKIPAGVESIAPALAGGAGVGVAAKALGAGAATVERAALAGSAAAAGMQSAGGTYGDAFDAFLRVNGGDTDKARTQAIKPALISGLITSIATFAGGTRGVESVFREPAGRAMVKNTLWNAIKSAAPKVTREAFEEFAEEGVDQLGQGILARSTYQPDKPISEIIGETLEAGALGAILGGGIGGLNVGREGVSKESAAIQGAADMAASDAELAAYQPAATGNPDVDAQAEVAPVRAQVLRDIGQGKPLEELENQQLASIGLQRDQKGEVKPAKGKDAMPAAVSVENGKPIILQPALDELAQQFPKTRALIGMGEVEARQKAQAVQVEPQSAGDAGQAAPSAPLSTQDQGVSGNVPQKLKAQEKLAQPSTPSMGSEAKEGTKPSVPQGEAIAQTSWTATTDKGTVVSIPATAAASRAEAELALAAQVPTGELLDPASVQEPQAPVSAPETEPEKGEFDFGEVKIIRSVSTPAEASKETRGQVKTVLDRITNRKSAARVLGLGRILEKAIADTASKFSGVDFVKSPSSSVLLSRDMNRLSIDVAKVLRDMGGKSVKAATEWLDAAIEEEFKHRVAVNLEMTSPRFKAKMQAWYNALPEHLKELSRATYFGDVDTKNFKNQFEKLEGDETFAARHEAFRQYWTNAKFQKMVEEAMHENGDKTLLDLIEAFIKELKRLAAGEISPALKSLSEDLIAQAEAKAAELKGIPAAQPTTPETNAARPITKQEGGQQKHPGTAPRPAVPADVGEVRAKEGAGPSGGNRPANAAGQPTKVGQEAEGEVAPALSTAPSESAIPNRPEASIAYDYAHNGLTDEQLSAALDDQWRSFYIAGKSFDKTDEQITDEWKQELVDPEGYRVTAAIQSWKQVQRATDYTPMDVQREPSDLRDAEYMAAVRSGDMEAAQRMVDEAAKRAGYNIGPVYHGTFAKDFFTEFDLQKLGTGADLQENYTEGYSGRGFYFDPVKANADQWAKFGAWEPEGRKARTIAAYLKFKNPIIHKFDSEGPKPTPKDGDGVISVSNEGTPLEYVAFSPSQIKSADPVTYDDQGNVIPLSKRFNPESPSILYTAPDESDEEAIKALNEMVFADLPSDEEIAALQEFHESEAPGEYTVGNPERANLGQSEADRKFDNVMREIYEDAILRRVDMEDLDRAGKQRADQDPSGVQRAVLEAYKTGQPLSALDTKAAQHLFRELRRKAHLSGDDKALKASQAFTTAYLGTGTEWSRAGMARRDTTKTKEERFAEYLLETLDNPQRIQQKIDLEAMPRAADKERRIAQLTREIESAQQAKNAAEEKAKMKERDVERRKETREDLALKIAKQQRDEIAKALKKEGLTIEDLLDNRIQYRIKFGRLVMDAMGRKDAQREKAIDLIVHGWSTREIVRATKLLEMDVASIRDELRSKPQPLREALARAIQRGFDITKIAANMLSTSPTAQTMSWEDALKEADRILDKLIPTTQEADQSRWKKVRRARPGDQGADAALQRTISALENPKEPRKSTPDAVRDLIRLHRSKKGVNDFVRKAVELGADQELAQKAHDLIEAERARKAKPITEVDLDVEYVPYDINDPKQTYRVMRRVESKFKPWYDMIREFWINSILSGLITQTVNLVGNAAVSAYELTVERGLEATFGNLMGKKNAAQSFGEYKHLVKGLLPGIVEGSRIAMGSWSTEQDVFEQKFMGKDAQDEDDIDRHGPVGAIPGKLGRAVRIPGRALRASDGFFKTVIAKMEVGAMAHRLGRSKGLTGANLERFIASEVARPGSKAWMMAISEAHRRTFTDSNATVKTVSDLLNRNASRKMHEAQALAAAKRGDMEEARAHIGAAKRAAVIGAMLSFVFPFVRTPVNIFRMGIKKSPLGSLWLAGNIAQGLVATARGQGFFNKYPAALLTKHLTEQSIAWAAWMALYSIAEGDDDDDKKKWMLVGGRPYSQDTGSGDADAAKRMYGGTYMLVHRNESGVIDARVPFGRVEPFATALGGMIDAMGQIKRHWRNRKEGENMKAAQSISRGVASNLLGQAQDKTFLRGFSDVSALGADLMDASGARSGAGLRFLTNIAAGFVPNIGKQAVRALDDYERNYKQSEWSHSWWPDGKSANPMVDYFTGEDVTKGGPKWLRLVWPTPLNIQQAQSPTDTLIQKWNLKHPVNVTGDENQQESRYFPRRPDARSYVVKTGHGKNDKRPMTLPEMRVFDQAAGTNFRQAQSYLTPQAAKLGSFADVLKLQKNLSSARSQAKAKSAASPQGHPQHRRVHPARQGRRCHLEASNPQRPPKSRARLNR
jgi:hypothetical protein